MNKKYTYVIKLLQQRVDNLNMEIFELQNYVVTVSEQEQQCLLMKACAQQNSCIEAIKELEAIQYK